MLRQRPLVNDPNTFTTIYISPKKCFCTPPLYPVFSMQAEDRLIQSRTYHPRPSLSLSSFHSFIHSLCSLYLSLFFTLKVRPPKTRDLYSTIQKNAPCPLTAVSIEAHFSLVFTCFPPPFSCRQAYIQPIYTPPAVTEKQLGRQQHRGPPAPMAHSPRRPRRKAQTAARQQQKQRPQA